MSIEIKVVKLEEVLDRMKSTFPNHVKETELYQDKMEFNPDYDAYLTLSEAGGLYFVVAEDLDTQEIVGYLSLMVHFHPHHKDVLTATNNLIYVNYNYRGKGISMGMLEEAEKFLKDAEVDLFMFSAKASNPLKDTAKVLGFDECEVVYSKYIGDKN